MPTLFKMSMIWLMLVFVVDARAGNLERLTEGKWIHATSKNFDVVTDLDEEHAHRMVQDLETYRYFVITILKLRVLNDIKPLKILALSNDKKLQALGFPKLWAGVFTNTLEGGFSVINAAQETTSNQVGSYAKSVLLHEYNHFLLRTTEETLAYPTWYDEGISDYLATLQFDGKQVVIGQEAEGSARGLGLFLDNGLLDIHSEKLMDITTLPVHSDDQIDQREITRFYSQAFFLTHYFNSTLELRNSLAHYLRLIRLGYKESLALSKAFGKTHQQLDKDAETYLTTHFSSRIFSIKDAKALLPNNNIEVQVLNAASTFKYLTEVLVQFKLSDNDKNDAIIKQLVEKNLQLNPFDADAIYFSALHTSRQKKSGDAIELLGKNSSHARSLTLIGNHRFADGKARYFLNLPDWEKEIRQARDYFRRAINIDPQLAAPYDGLGQTYTFLPDPTTLQEGVISLDSASIYDRNHITFMRMANLLFRMNKPLDALPVLRNALAFDSHKANSSHALITENLEMLNDLLVDKGKPDAAGLLFESGDIYQGALNNGKPDGTGKIMRPNGSYFEGQFHQGIMQGQGRLVTAGGFVYQGEFTDGIARGKGQITYPPDSAQLRYDGDIDFGLPHGLGTRDSKIGQFSGQFIMAQENGEGRYISKRNHQSFSGQWRHGKFIWPEENNIVFAGDIDAEGRRDGAGHCLEKSNQQIRSCSYQHGVLQ